MTRDADLSARDWVALVRRGLRGDRHRRPAGSRSAGGVRLYLFTPTSTVSRRAAPTSPTYLIERPRPLHRAATISSPCSGRSSASPAPRTSSRSSSVPSRVEAPEGFDDRRRPAMEPGAPARRNRSATPELIDEEFERDRLPAVNVRRASARAATPTEEPKTLRGEQQSTRTSSPTPCSGRPSWVSTLPTMPSSTVASSTDTSRCSTTSGTPGPTTPHRAWSWALPRIPRRAEHHRSHREVPRGPRRSAGTPSVAAEGADGVRRSLRAQQAY